MTLSQSPETTVTAGSGMAGTDIGNGSYPADSGTIMLPPSTSVT